MAKGCSEAKRATGETKVKSTHNYKYVLIVKFNKIAVVNVRNIIMALKRGER